MAEKEGMRVSGVDMLRVALDTFAFKVGGYRFRYMLWGKQLWWEGALLAEGVTSARECVAMAKGVVAVKEFHSREDYMSPEAYRDARSRHAAEAKRWSEEEVSGNEQQ